MLSNPSTRSLAGREILQTLLILNADRGATELVGDPDRGDVHFALLKNLVLGELRSFVVAELKLHPFFSANHRPLARFVVADLEHRSVKR